MFSFDEYAGRKYIYPNNMEVRPYQRQAVEMALFKNAMIVLPTGFGKTFIAAVVMYNYYRWYPTGKVIFMAPTRPLVTQQMSECKKISGIPASECIELTGAISAERRMVYWSTKRVFFATPQVIENDLKENILPATEVRCLVLDEAHKAQGGYAYVGIVRALQESNRNGFRVLAMSATPGSDIERVQQVMLNLYISAVMFRSEQSIDLCQFKNQKVSKAWTLELPPKHRRLVDQFIKICDPTIKELYRTGALWSADSLEKVSRFVLVKAMKAGGSHDQASNRISKGKFSYLVSSALSMTHQFELLALYGIRVFYSSITKNLAAPRSCLKTALASSVDFTRMLDEIKGMFGDDIEIDAGKKPTADILQSHPKLGAVKDLLLKHFSAKQEEDQSTRAIVFTKYQESVHDIVQCLKVYEPLIKAAVFVGQSGMKQKDQIEMVRDFREGKYNVIVATCVAEEGLDIGEVDLIICYDTTSSPISNTQRRGRTGRKRAGDVQTLCTKGYEEKKLSKAGQSRRQVEDQLFNSKNYVSFQYKNAPRMVPADIVPECLMQKVYPMEEDDGDKAKEKPKRKRQKKVEVEAEDLKKKSCSIAEDEDTIDLE